MTRLAARLAELTPRTPGRRDRSPVRELALTEVCGNLTYTTAAVTAWYTVPEIVWAFRPDPEREALLDAIAQQFAGLAGLRLHLRRTSHPFEVDAWAGQLATHAVLPNVPGAPTWAQHVEAARAHLAAAGHAEGRTLLGVTFARRHLGDTVTEWVRRRVAGDRGVTAGERDGHARRAAGFAESLAGHGLSARPATPQALSWLLYQSVGFGLAPLDHPGHDLEPSDVLALTERFDRYHSRYGSTVRIVDRHTGAQRHVAVLTVGRMEPLTIPQVHEPWLHLADSAGFPVEISCRIDLLPPALAAKSLERKLRIFRAQLVDYADHGLDAPPELDRLASRALETGDRIATGLPVDAVRAHGWHRLAVWGDTAAQALERARDLTALYQQRARIVLRQPKAQPRLAGEFIPGQPLADTGYVRRMPVQLLAAAVPQATATVGDSRGDLIGHTAATSRRPVFFDPHYPMEVRERSGLAVLVSEPGGGKSTLIGSLAYLATRRGIQVTLLDPSGPLARLGQMPELAPHTRVLNLYGAHRGTLAPYALIPTPRPADYPGCERIACIGADQPVEISHHAVAVANARAERRMLALDIAMMLLPPQHAGDPDVVAALRHAIRTVPAEETATLEDVIDALDDPALGVAGKQTALLLGDAAELPLAALFFGQPAPGVLADTAPLTIITMGGLRLPDLAIERQYWSTEEALALPMLHAAHRLAVRRCYGADTNRRKLVGLDEAHFMQGWASGRSFLVRLARDSRKWNIAALVASQNPADILGLDVQNLVSTVFVGRIVDDPQIAAEALRLLRLPTGAGYEQTLAALSQHDPSDTSRLGFREFVMRDVDGRVQKIRVDVSYVDGLLDHLDTTPGGAQ
jgi:hypothetical protein